MRCPVQLLCTRRIQHSQYCHTELAELKQEKADLKEEIKKETVARDALDEELKTDGLSSEERVALRNEKAAKDNVIAALRQQ